MQNTISIVDSTFYRSLMTLKRGNYSEKQFVEVLSGLKRESSFRILQEERTSAYFDVANALGYGIHIDSASSSFDGLGAARFNLKYSSKHPVSGKSLCTASRLEEIFAEARSKTLNIEEVSEALEEDFVIDTWSKHQRRFYAPFIKIIGPKEPETQEEMVLHIPGTLVVNLRETPKYAHDRYCTEFNLEINAKLTPEFPKSMPVKKTGNGASTGPTLGSASAYKHP